MEKDINMKPLVSVIVTTYNGATRGYLDKAINSVLSQTYPNFEIIIVNDGSSDGTKDICSKYFADSRVKYFEQENKGISAARNTGIRGSRGDYICFLDDDDVYKREKLNTQVRFFQNHPDKQAGMVYHSIDIIDGQGSIIGEQSHQADGRIFEKLFFENLVDGTCSVMIKKEVFDKIGMFREEMISDEDNEMWMRIAKHYPVYSFPERLSQVRIHPRGRLMNHEKRMEFYQLMTFYYMLKDVSNIDENRVYNNLYQRFSIKHFYLKNFFECRKYYKFASAYGKTSLKLKWFYCLATFPSIVFFLKKIKRMIKKETDSN